MLPLQFDIPFDDVQRGAAGCRPDVPVKALTRAEIECFGGYSTSMCRWSASPSPASNRQPFCRRLQRVIRQPVECSGIANPWSVFCDAHQMHHKLGNAVFFMSEALHLTADQVGCNACS